MKIRFIQSVAQRAKQDRTEMPWARGQRRAAMIARRKDDLAPRKSA